MTTSHLENTVKFLERSYRRACLANSMAADAYAVDAPDGAAMAAEQVAEECFEKAQTLEGIGDWSEHYDALVHELNKRRPKIL